jgi:hypothetical protein
MNVATRAHLTAQASFTTGRDRERKCARSR